MYIKQATVNNQVGLHARPATFFIQKANEFKSTIWVEKDEQRVNAKSLLGVLSRRILLCPGTQRQEHGGNQQQRKDAHKILFHCFVAPSSKAG